MSVDLSIPIIKPIAMSELVLKSYNAASQLIGTSAAQIDCVELVDGKSAPAKNSELAIGTLYLFSWKGDLAGSIEVIVVDGTFDLGAAFPEASKTATVSVRAVADRPHILPLAAAVASAIADLQGTAIFDEAAFFSTSVQTSATEFVRRLKIDTGANLREAGRVFSEHLPGTKRCQEPN